MSDRLICEIRLFTCIFGIATGLWVGYEVINNSNYLNYALFSTVPVCGIVGWLLGSFSNVLIKPKWVALGYLLDMVGGIVIGYIILAMIYSLIPLSVSPAVKKTAWAFWISNALAFIIGTFSSAEASIDQLNS